MQHVQQQSKEIEVLVRPTNSTKFFSLIACLATLALGACNSKLTANQPSSIGTIDNGSQDTGGTDSTEPEQPLFNLKAQADYYRQRYGLKDPNSKLVSNSGKGYEDLYGARNLRVVLHGVYYRGGANNIYNKYDKRGNENPLPDLGLKNLCEEGFSESLYFYSENYETAPKTTSCVNLNRENSVLNYGQVGALSVGNEKKILQKVFDHIKGTQKGPMYGHCWNGWHASGYAAAISLRQFCDWSPDAAEAYWIKNTDGNSTGYKSIKNRIKTFKPLTEFKISVEEKSAICP